MSVISVSFEYDGKNRIVDNITYDEQNKLIIGFEVRKSGQFSYRIKKYSQDKIKGIRFIDPVKRIGPTIGRP